jgi:hypothetical protein
MAKPLARGFDPKKEISYANDIRRGHVDRKREI